MQRFDDRSTLTIDADDVTGTVTAIRDLKSGTQYDLPLTARRWVVGTNDSCDIVLADKCVSGMHCTLERRSNGALMVRDRNSRNGTLVDGNVIEAAELRVGSHLQIGRTTLVAIADGARGPTCALEALRGTDQLFRTTVDRALRAAQTDCNVLIVGETGTGKDLLARAIHEASRRSRERFVAVNCGAIPRELIGSELFGHQKGSFTGATSDRDGYFVEADRGTLFLDELGELPLELQPNLLRVLETRRVRRVGGDHERAVDVRIVAATNRLENLGLENSRIRMDLYHRLATVVLCLPPLRDRVADIRDLVLSMLDQLAVEHGPKTITEDAWRVLCSHSWPGNVRELRHAVERAVALGGYELTPEDFFPTLRMGMTLPFGHLPVVVADGQELPYHSMMRKAMENALLAHGSIRAAAAHLGMAKSTFADKAKQWGLTPKPKKRCRDDD